MKTFKRISALLLALLLALTCSVGALAADNSMQFHFDLTVDGEHTKNVLPGDIITVVFTLKRTDSDANYSIYGVQDEIEYDPEFFEFVEGSALLMPGIDKSQVNLVGGMQRFYMNYLSLGSDGTEWPATTTLGSFQLRVIAETGVSHICNKAYFVSTKGGADTYAATKDDVTVILSSECIIRFDSNGGSDVPEQRVPYGEKIPRPDDPTREGKYFAGWFTDILHEHPWDFDNDTVEGNMTLYAGWSDTPLDNGETQTGGGHLLAWLLPLLGVLLLLIILLLLRKRVRFETFGGTELDDVRVWRGAKLETPAAPLKTGSLFGGWYKDEACTQPWNFDEDTVDKNMTLYARWN